MSCCLGAVVNSLGQNRAIPGSPRKATPSSFTITENGQVGPSQLPEHLLWPGVWKDGTNGLRVGLDIQDAQTGNPKIVIAVGSQQRNSLGEYVEVSRMRFTKLLLVNSSGSQVAPNRELGLELDPPALWAVSRSDWNTPRPKVRDIGIFTNGLPHILLNATASDCFDVKHGGVYTIIVRPAIYRRTAGSNRIERVDLDELTAKITILGKVSKTKR